MVKSAKNKSGNSSNSPQKSSPKKLQKKPQRKPAKPYRTFPLTAHNNGQWCKKIRGKVYFFGVWANPEAALADYHRVAADLHAGRKPKDRSLLAEAVTVKDVCDHYLTYQLRRAEAAEISASRFHDCRRTLQDFAAFAGRARVVEDMLPEDFEAYRQKLLRKGLIRKKKLGVHALDRSVGVVKAAFDYAYQNDLLERPVKLGVSFKGSSAAAKRRSRGENQVRHGKKLFTVEAIEKMLERASVPLRAMILLGINGGMGNKDCGRLPTRIIQFEKALIEFPRPKTGIDRVVPLWPETLEALYAAMAERPKPADARFDEFFFLTTFGQPWYRDTRGMYAQGNVTLGSRSDAVREEFDKVLTKLGLKRKGIGFYSLRHTFRTWAGEVQDPHAVYRIMGHVVPGMDAYYVEDIELPRLRAVAEHVRGKLFGTMPAAP